MQIARSAAGLCDISPTGKLLVQGQGLQEMFWRQFGFEWIRGRAGRVEAGVPYGVTAAILTEDEVLLLAQPSEVAAVFGSLTERLEGCAHLVDVTSSYAGIQIVGPRNHRLLAKLAELDLDPAVFEDGSCVQGKAAEVHVLVLRSDLKNLLSYELYVTRDFGEYMWNALLHAGRSEGAGPIGVEAMDKLTAGS